MKRLQIFHFGVNFIDEVKGMSDDDTQDTALEIVTAKNPLNQKNEPMYKTTRIPYEKRRPHRQEVDNDNSVRVNTSIIVVHGVDKNTR